MMQLLKYLKDSARRHRGEPEGSIGRGDSEAGFTLVELLVVMPALLIVTSLAMVTLVTAYKSGSIVQSTSSSSNQVDLAFITLDGEVRYAADINTPGADSGNYYVEWESDWTQNTLGYSQCTQLEYTTTGVLQQRSWDASDSVPTAGWNTLASGLQTGISSDPFSLSTTQGTPWQLTISLTALSGSGRTAASTQSKFTITSLDTDSSSVSSGVCGGTP